MYSFTSLICSLLSIINFSLSPVSRYYSLAHAVNERVIRQPSMLRTGTLRDYQLVGF